MGNFELAEPKRNGSKMDPPLSNEMRTATKEMDRLHVEYEIKSPYHLRVGYINYYPTAGTVNIDGQRRFKKTGIPFLISVLQREGVIP